MGYITADSGVCLSTTGDSCLIDEAVTSQSGKCVIISNTCSLPLTITGMTNSDPLRFTLFQFPLYSGSGIYHSGMAEFPIELPPNTMTGVNTFWHPTSTDLLTGGAGAFTNRTGSYYTGRVDIFPGFPVLNCVTGNTGECEAFFTLSGEFICDAMNVPTWLDNSANFVSPIL